MAVPSDDLSRRLIAYFHDCLEGEFAHQDFADPFDKAQHAVRFFVAPEGRNKLNGGGSDNLLRFGDIRGIFDQEKALKLSGRYQLVRQDYQLMVGLISCSTYDDNVELISKSPLFVGAIEQLPPEPKSNDVLVNLLDLNVNPAFTESFPGCQRTRLPLEANTWTEFQQRFRDKQPQCVLDKVNDPVRDVYGWLWLRKRSRIGRSVLHELSELSAKGAELSDPVARLLGYRATPSVAPAASTPELIPTSPTKPQEAAVLNGARFPLSVINGPPGTGKTHTIACQVVDAVINQRSTLIVCSNDQSADVVREKITGMLSGSEHVVLRPGRGDYKQELVEQISHWLDGEYKAAHDDTSLARITESLEESSRHYHQTEKRFFRAIADAERSTDRRGGALDWIRSWWSDMRTSRSPLLTEHWRDLQVAIAEHQDCMSRFLHLQLDHRLHQLLSDHRKALVTLSKALRSRASHTRNERFQALDWSIITRVFPVWVVSASDLNDSIPMTTELFDLVIVDEATQCNLAQALPALQRGKRAVIVGDAKQLRHYSFLARKVQDEAALKHELKDAPVDLDYRSRSLLDYAIDALPDRGALAFLDEHFRSNPVLIDFSNERFYNNRVKILTAHRQNQPDQPLQIVACPVEEKDNINLAEVGQVLETLHSLISQYRDSSNPPGIGVLGMVRATALMLEDRITREISLEDISRHQLRVGTPYAFQGDERDIMLVASCAWPGQVHGTQRYLERDDVFNVAVTRARQRQVFFHGDGLVEAEPERLASRYVRHGQQSRQDRDHRESTSEAGDPVLQELSSWFAARGLRARPNLPFAGQLVELTVEVDQQLVAIDLVGRRDARCDVGKAWDPARYRLLERAGLVLTPIARRHWLNRRGEVMADLERQLSIGDHHAPLNQPLKSPLYRRLRELGPVGGADGPSPAELFDQLHKASRLVEFWLKQHFAPEELTYQRYNRTRSTLLQQAEKKLEGISLILESFRELGAPGELQDTITKRVSECEQAVASLVALGRELAELEASDINATVDELQRLTDRVSDYR